jgi:hypothetical protein
LICRQTFDPVQTPEMATTGSTAVAMDPPKAQGFSRRYGKVIESEADSGTKVSPL